MGATTWLPEMVRDTLGSLLIDFRIYGAPSVLQFPFDLNISRLCGTKGKNPGFQVSGFQFRKEKNLIACNSWNFASKLRISSSHSISELWNGKILSFATNSLDWRRMEFRIPSARKASDCPFWRSNCLQSYQCPSPIRHTMPGRT